MEIYDLIENIKLWLDLYRESSTDDRNSENWKKGMLKVLSRFSVAEELNATPFKQKLEDIINFAKNEELNKITDIYNELDGISKYFQENYNNLN